MWYNMVGHAAYQVVVMMLLYYDLGAKLLGTAPNGTPHHGKCGGAQVYSKHHSALFNCFVAMTLFNEINCRKLRGEWNVFSGLFKNPYFGSIWISAVTVPQSARRTDSIRCATPKGCDNRSATKGLLCSVTTAS